MFNMTNHTNQIDTFSHASIIGPLQLSDLNLPRTKGSPYDDHPMFRNIMTIVFVGFTRSAVSERGIEWTESSQSNCGNRHWTPRLFSADKNEQSRDSIIIDEAASTNTATYLFTYHTNEQIRAWDTYSKLKKKRLCFVKIDNIW